MSAVIEILAAVLILAGGGIVAMAALGVARLTDPFMRLHAAAKSGAAGSGLLLLGVGLAFGTWGAVLTSIAALAFLLLTTPVASHALGRAAYVAGAPLGAASLADGLNGILHRKVFDIDPARTLRRRATHGITQEREPAMSSVPHFRRPADPSRTDPARGPQPATTPVALRHVLCGLVGGPAQHEASMQALALARGAGAKLLGLSGAGMQPRRWEGPVPIGGTYWADWLAGRSLARQREAAAVALQDFEALTREEKGLDITIRHEESSPQDLARLLAGHDLIVLPAGAGPHGLACGPEEEIAGAVARAHILPVLRVRQRPEAVRRAMLLVGDTPGCGALAAGLLRSGLWPAAEVAVLPLGEDRPALRDLSAAQASLLEAHGRRVTLLPALDSDADVIGLRARLARCDLAVMSCLSTRHGGVFDSLRVCLHEEASERVPLVLLP